MNPTPTTPAEPRPLDIKSFALGVLGLMAVVLVALHLVKPAPAIATEAVSNRDYQAATAETTGGGDAVYILDNRTGVIAVLTYDQNRKQLVARDARTVVSMFR
ncbi:MAG: hypothetical protein AAF656_09925 [Planctomycetota bacterium]